MAQVTPSVLAENSGINSAGTSVSVTLSPKPAVGDVVVVCISEGASLYNAPTTKVTSVTDNATGGTNTFSLITKLEDGTGNVTSSVYWAALARTRTDATLYTVTVQFSATSAMRVTLLSLSDVDLGDAVNASSTYQTTTGTTCYAGASGEIDTDAHVLAVAMFTATADTSTWTTTGSWVEQRDGAYGIGGSSTQLVATLASDTALADERGEATCSASTRAAGIIVAFLGYSDTVSASTSESATVTESASAFAAELVSGSVAVSVADTGAVETGEGPEEVFEPGQSFGPLVWVEILGPDETIHVSAPITLADPATYYHGYKAPRMLGVGRIARALSDELGQYESQRFSVSLDDIDRQWRTWLGDIDTRLILNKRVTVRMISEEAWRQKLRPRTVAMGLIRDYRLE